MDKSESEKKLPSAAERKAEAAERAADKTSSRRSFDKGLEVKK